MKKSCIYVDSLRIILFEVLIFKKLAKVEKGQFVEINVFKVMEISVIFPVDKMSFTELTMA